MEGKVAMQSGRYLLKQMRWLRLKWAEEMIFSSVVFLQYLQFNLEHWEVSLTLKR